MTDETKTSLTTVVDSNGNLIDPSITKMEDVELDICEVVEDLKEQRELVNGVVKELADFAGRAQNPDHYKALALVIQAAAKLTREQTVALKLRGDHILSMRTDNQSAAPSTVIQDSNVIMTTTDMIRQLRSEDNG